MKNKKSIMLLLAILGVFFLFSPAVSAHEGDECGCEQAFDVTEVTGAEKNKLVADLLKSDGLKAMKKDLKENDYLWNGVNGIEIEYNKENNEYLIVIPVLDSDRTEESYLFYAYGKFDGPYTKEEVAH